MNLEKRYWHYAYWKEFYNWVYSKSLSWDDIMDNGKLFQQEKFESVTDDGKSCWYTVPLPEDTWYKKFHKNDDYYIVPKRFTETMPINITSFDYVKLRPSDTQTWKYVTGASSLKIPERRTSDLNTFLKNWNPMDHSNPLAWHLLKMIMLARGVKIGICGDYGVGKNANLTLRKTIDGRTIAEIKSSSKAIFYQELYNNDYSNIDEVTSWSKPELGAVEDMIAEMGAESPDLTKYAKDQNKSREKMNDILYKSLTMTFNPYHEKNNPYTFDEKFRNPGKIKDRYPLLFLSGKVKDSIPKPSIAEAESVVASHLETFKSIASEFMYWRNNYDKHLHGWDRSKCKFRERHLSNISPLLDVIDVCSDSQKTFDKWLAYLWKCKEQYDRKSEPSTGENLLLKEEDV